MGKIKRPRSVYRIDLSNPKAVKESIRKLRYSKRQILLERKFIAKVLRDSEDIYLKPLMDKLSQYPERRKYPEDYPVKFVSDKQRRFVMWKLRGKPYRRTNKTGSGWTYELTVKNGYVSLKVYNMYSHSKYVVGSIGMGKSYRSIKRYTKNIQPFHTITGWKPAYKEAQPDLELLKKHIERRIKNWYKAYNKSSMENGG